MKTLLITLFTLLLVFNVNAHPESKTDTTIITSYTKLDGTKQKLKINLEKRVIKLMPLELVIKNTFEYFDYDLECKSSFNFTPNKKGYHIEVVLLIEDRVGVLANGIFFEYENPKLLSNMNIGLTFDTKGRMYEVEYNHQSKYNGGEGNNLRGALYHGKYTSIYLMDRDK